MRTCNPAERCRAGRGHGGLGVGGERRGAVGSGSVHGAADQPYELHMVFSLCSSSLPHEKAAKYFVLETARLSGSDPVPRSQHRAGPSPREAVAGQSYACRVVLVPITCTMSCCKMPERRVHYEIMHIYYVLVLWDNRTGLAITSSRMHHDPINPFATLP